jgi:Astacin (Peptidase family M12A)
MTENGQRLRDALIKIADMANAAVNDGENQDQEYDAEESTYAPEESQLSCIPKSLPQRLLVKAAEVAVEINPVNAPMFGPLAAMATELATGASDIVMDPQRIAVITGKYWGPTPRRLTVSFMESTPADLRARIISHLNAWTRTGCVEFMATQGTGEVRISRGSGGYWSYLGTDIRLIPRNRPTMNLQGFTMNTSESEYRRVVRHEAGHTLGFPHEHMRRELVARIDPEKAYEYFRRTQGWDRRMVDQQVLTPLDNRTIMFTPADQDSIMCYQLPGSITRDGQPIRGGMDVNQSDYAFVGRIYPKPGQDLMSAYMEEWDESEDAEVLV